MTNGRQAKTAREKAAEMRAQAARQESRRRNVLILAAVAAVLVVAVGVGVLVQFTRSSNPATAAVTTPANSTNNGFVVGSSSAPVTIVAYEDYQCPACKNFEDLNGAQIDQWIADGTVKVNYRAIAFLDRMSSTNYSTRALNAAAAVMNSDPADYKKFHDLLYANQPAENSAGLTNDQLIQYAVQAGAKEADIRPAVQNETYKPWTVKVTDAATNAGINSTPTVQVNGSTLADYSPDKLKAAVQAAQKK